MTGGESPSATGLLRWLATLSDLVRLRMMRLLETDELSVGELATILQLPQSTVSRHLKLLFEAGLLLRRSEGTASLYRVDVDGLPVAAAALWMLVRQELQPAATFDEDERRRVAVLAERPSDSESFFGRIGGDWDRVRSELFGERFTAEALLGLLDRSWRVADLGCGTGTVTQLLAPAVGELVAVDREPAMLEAARTRLGHIANVQFRQSDIAALDLEEGSFDAAVVFVVLVYLEQPGKAFSEMARILRPGGVGLVVDLVRHDRETYRHTLGHRHLGFSASDLTVWADAAGFADCVVRTLPPEPRAKGPGLFVATLRR